MERDWLDYAGFVFNTLATTVGVVGFFIAVNAYRLAKQQGRKTFELEVLRELTLELDRMMEDAEEFPRRSPLPRLSPGALGRIHLLPEVEVQAWRFLHEVMLGNAKPEDLVELTAAKRFREGGNERESYSLYILAVNVLANEVIHAMRKRLQ
ncbi:hypothetical protein ACLQ3D_20980 [Micromonospora vinacea]|uniref:Uncharacterized protein n=1 Tax=Micromonospora vinacea TaxID=709878 RepID=A0ABS0JTW8_9ACTN|nr:hypothetical protein [Micromonospora vinacea]MBG6099802.1 hypothetical protein [Micromonospora vinacea]